MKYESYIKYQINGIIYRYAGYYLPIVCSFAPKYCTLCIKQIESLKVIKILKNT